MLLTLFQVRPWPLEPSWQPCRVRGDSLRSPELRGSQMGREWKEISWILWASKLSWKELGLARTRGRPCVCVRIYKCVQLSRRKKRKSEKPWGRAIKPFQDETLAVKIVQHFSRIAGKCRLHKERSRVQVDTSKLSTLFLFAQTLR